MRVLQGSHEGEWLGRRMGGWARVGGVAGTGFDAYARVLHPLEGTLLDWTPRGAGMVPQVADERPWTWAEIAAAQGAIMHPLVQWNRLAGAPDREVEIDGWTVRPPEAGWCDPRLMAAMVPALAGATATPDDAVLAIWVGFGELHPGSGSIAVMSWEGAGDLAEEAPAFTPARVSDQVSAALVDPHLLRLPGREYLRVACALSELEDPDWGYALGLGWQRPHRHPAPQLVWPRDRAWVVATEIDWDSTIVAGSRALIDALLADPSLEAYEVTEESDLTYDGDTVNAPRAAS